MKQSLIFIFILSFLLTACTDRKEYNELLIQADSLIQSSPDSALNILEGIMPDSLNTKADHAYYALLLTKARDKNYILQKNDSLIETAVRYYDTTKETGMQAQAYYYWGSVYRDKNEQAKAINKYLRAIPLAQKAKDKVLLGRIYANAGYIYYLQDFYDKADSIYRQAEQIGIQLKDTLLWATCLAAEGRIQLYQKDYSSAEKKLIHALAVLKDIKQNRIKANIFSALSSLYTKTGDAGKALQYAKQNASLQEDTLHCYRAFLELGDAYFYMKQYDSATIYLRKSLASPSYSNKESVYMRLADIAKAQGNMIQFANTEYLLSTYKDSVNLFSQKNEIIETEHTVEIKRQQVKYEHYLQEYRYYLFTLIFLIIGVIYFLRKRYLKKILLQKRERVIKEEELRKKYILMKEEAEKKEEKISALEQEIANHYTDEIQRENKQKELIELNNQYTELLKKTLKYSDVYNKLKRIVMDCKEHGHSKQYLSEDEWDRFISEIDKNSTFHKFAISHKFDEKEIHDCYLILADFSIKERTQILRIAHATIYRIEKRIFEKVGVQYQAKGLQKLLKSIIQSNTIDK